MVPSTRKISVLSPKVLLQFCSRELIFASNPGVGGRAECGYTPHNVGKSPTTYLPLTSKKSCQVEELLPERAHGSFQQAAGQFPEGGYNVESWILTFSVATCRPFESRAEIERCFLTFLPYIERASEN
jgi:hypothetical protein